MAQPSEVHFFPAGRVWSMTRTCMLRKTITQRRDESVTVSGVTVKMVDSGPGVVGIGMDSWEPVASSFCSHLEFPFPSRGCHRHVAAPPRSPFGQVVTNPCVSLGTCVLGAAQVNSE